MTDGKTTSVGQGTKMVIAYCHGIDFPYWLNWDNGKKRIMVIGINANRELKDWTDFDENKDDKL